MFGTLYTDTATVKFVQLQYDMLLCLFEFHT